MKKVLLLAGILVATAATYRVGYDDESVYNSLDVLAEIMTVTQAHSPEKIDGQELVEGAISGLLEQLDPHSNFYNRDRYRTMREDQHGTFYGIGIIVGFQNDKLTVVSPLAGAPAAMAGVRAGDVIAEIDGTDTESMPTYEAIRLLRGEKGTPVNLKLMRSGLDEKLPITLYRAEIPSYNVRASFMVNEKTGYVALKDFGETATAEVQEALEKLSPQGMEQLILDLRGNPGGLLPQAIGLAGLFLPGEKLVVSTKGRLRNANKEYFSTEEAPYENLPLIVLIDRGSASASEIVAGAIQDHDRGLILGVNSWGKGLVQSVFPLSQGEAGLALTTSRYYTPSGRNIQGSYESLEDYYNYNGKDPEALFYATEGDMVYHKTAHGRRVLESRGITPDVYLPFAEIPEISFSLESKHTAFFNFAAEQQDKFDITASFVVDDELLNKFKHWLDEKGIEHDGFETHREYMRQKLTFQFLYIDQNPESEAWAWAYRMKHDHHILSALDLFPQAQELYRVYIGQGTLPVGYTESLKAYSRSHKPKPLQRAALPSEDNLQ